MLRPSEPTWLFQAPPGCMLNVPFGYQGKSGSGSFLTPRGKPDQALLPMSASCPTSAEEISYKSSGNPEEVKLESAFSSKNNVQSSKFLREAEKKRSQNAPRIIVNEVRNGANGFENESDAATTTSLHMNVMDRIPFIRQEPGAKNQQRNSRRKSKLTVNTGPRYGYRGGESSDGSPCSADAKNVSRKISFYFLSSFQWE